MLLMWPVAYKSNTTTRRICPSREALTNMLHDNIYQMLQVYSHFGTQWEDAGNTKYSRLIM